MLHRLCGPPSIPLSFSLATVLPRRGTYCVSSGTEMRTIPTPSAHRLRRGLPGYLIPFAPHALAPQRQYLSRRPPSPPTFFLISTHFTAPPGIRLPLQYSSPAVCSALPRLSRGLSRNTDAAAYGRFTPNNSEQRLPPPYYRGCWHGVSRLAQVVPSSSRALNPDSSFHLTEFYTPKGVFTHAALLRQGCPHCAKFPTAASRRSLGRVSVPVWLIILSDQRPIVVLVGHHPTNKLIGRTSLARRQRINRGQLSSQGRPQERMRYSTSFRRTIPHPASGQVRVPHPSAMLLMTRRPRSHPTCMC